MSQNKLPKSAMDRFKLNGRVAVITGGAGKLGYQHAEAIIEAGGNVVLLDINNEKLEKTCAELRKSFPKSKVRGLKCDITNPQGVKEIRQAIVEDFGQVDILINNAANNPHVGEPDEGSPEKHLSRLEEFPIEVWEQDILVGLTGAFLCSKEFGHSMAERNQGVILNIASDLSVIGPDQRLYKEPGISNEEQKVKPVTYSVVKAGIIGLTKYLSTYWAHCGVRVNALSFGGIYSSDLDPEFVTRLENLIPLGRMASIDEYKSTVVFIISDAASYITGQNLVLDGGRSVW